MRTAREAALQEARMAAADAQRTLEAELIQVKAETEGRLGAELARLSEEAECARQTAAQAQLDAAQALPSAVDDARRQVERVAATDIGRASGTGRRIAMAIAASLIVVTTAGSLVLAYRSRVATEAAAPGDAVVEAEPTPAPAAGPAPPAASALPTGKVAVKGAPVAFAPPTRDEAQSGTHEVAVPRREPGDANGVTEEQGVDATRPTAAAAGGGTAPAAVRTRRLAPLSLPPAPRPRP